MASIWIRAGQSLINTAWSLRDNPRTSVGILPLSNGRSERGPDLIDWKKRRKGARGFNAAKVNRLTQGWVANNRHIDADLREGLVRVRGRMRDLSVNNDYFRGYLRLVKNNVVGPAGFSYAANPREFDGKLDEIDKRRLEQAFAEWSRLGNCTVDGCLSFRDCQDLFIETLARDGETLIRKVPGFDNKYRFALQFMDADYLDENHFETLPGDRKIRFGIEFDRWKRPVAYHILTRHPGDATFSSTARTSRERVPASEIIHAFICERPGQSRGIPWGISAANRLAMLAGYEEAELVAARTNASKMGFYTTNGDEFEGDDDGEDEEIGDAITEAEPGTFEHLPPGWTMEMFDPKHPTSQVPEFMKSQLHGFSAGVGASYHRLANDLSGVNYSSGRIGELADRDHWRWLQNFMSAHFLDDVHKSWLEMGIMAAAGPLAGMPITKFDKFNSPTWEPRGWQWVDPQKEASANIDAVKAGMKSLTQIAREQGRSVEDIFAERQRETELAEKFGVTIDLGGTALANVPPETEKENDDPEND
mgnify:CR=1 FL=1|tara:strand:+ start:528 stop:2129 length:1602 start_codon:yes stop_codon:yes gene_type:complete